MNYTSETGWIIRYFTHVRFKYAQMNSFICFNTKWTNLNYLLKWIYLNTMYEYKSCKNKRSLH
jgi:hypothetical protein